MQLLQKIFNEINIREAVSEAVGKYFFLNSLKVLEKN